jgi:hypothetical protein
MRPVTIRRALPRARQRALGLVTLLLAAAQARGQATRVSAPIHDVAYQITADSASVGRRELAVAMSFRVDDRSPVLLALPAWSPGHYVLLWFAQRVLGFAAESDGAALPWRKVDFQTWRIEPRAAGVVRVTFRYRADALRARAERLGAAWTPAAVERALWAQGGGKAGARAAAAPDR